MAEKDQNLISRAPVVVVVGHIDHGKTALLDFIRKSQVAEKESGGITQHIGAYEIEHQGKKITFIDTPGHEAFSAMRSRGASVADIAILVVAADEGLKPQTKEALLHIEKAGIPFIVALNKIDKPTVNLDKVKGELAKNNILVESLGGKIPSVGTSAKTGEGIPELLEVILLVAEMENLKGDLNKPGEGLIIEAYQDAQRGPTATLLIRDGVINQGDIIGTPSTAGKVKIMENFKGKAVEKGFPSMPLIIIGFPKTPRVGEKFKIFKTQEEAQKYVEKKEQKEKKGEVMLIEPGVRVLNLIIKADVAGSLEAISEAMKSLPQDKIFLRILKGDVGDIIDSDVKLAQSSKAKILNFRVKISPHIFDLAEQNKVKIVSFDIIYDLIQGIRHIMEKSMKMEKVRTDLAKIKILLVFWTEKNRQIIGGKVTEGHVKRGAKIEVLRGEEVLGKGRMLSLQRNKKDIDEAKRGEEVGMLYEGDVKIEQGDILAIYTEEEVKEEL